MLLPLINACYDLNILKDIIPFTTIRPKIPGLYYRYFDGDNNQLHLISVIDDLSINAPGPMLNKDGTIPITYYSVNKIL